MRPVRTYGSQACGRTVCRGVFCLQNASVTIATAAQAETTVLVAVGSGRVREALVAMLGAQKGFRVVAEAATDEAALEAARALRPHLAVVETELSGCCGHWVIQQIRAQ